MSELNIIIGCDHGAYQLKDILVKQLIKDGIQVEDVGVSGHVAKGSSPGVAHADRGVVLHQQEGHRATDDV